MLKDLCRTVAAKVRGYRFLTAGVTLSLLAAGLAPAVTAQAAYAGGDLTLTIDQVEPVDRYAGWKFRLDIKNDSDKVLRDIEIIFDSSELSSSVRPVVGSVDCPQSFSKHYVCTIGDLPPGWSDHQIWIHLVPVSTRTLSTSVLVADVSWNYGSKRESSNKTFDIDVTDLVRHPASDVDQDASVSVNQKSIQAASPPPIPKRITASRTVGIDTSTNWVPSPYMGVTGVGVIAALAGIIRSLSLSENRAK